MVALEIGIDEQRLHSLYADPYIAKVGTDQRPAAPVIHPAAQYLSAFWKGKFCGAFLSIRFTALEFEVHALLKKQAVKHSRELGRAYLAWAFSHPIARVTAYILDSLDSAKNYCLKLGFKIEGFRRDAYSQGGVMGGVYVLGMTRADWEKS